MDDYSGGTLVFFDRSMTANEIKQVISTPLFWMLSAFGSVALGILGNLLTPRVSQFFEARSSKKRKVATKKRARLLGRVVVGFNQYPDSVTRYKLDSIYNLLFATAFLLVLLTLCGAVALVEEFIPSLLRLGLSILSVPMLWLAFVMMGEAIKAQRTGGLIHRRKQELQLYLEKDLPNKKSEHEFLSEWDKNQFGLSYDEASKALKDRES